MSSVERLTDIRLIPVVEMEPAAFAGPSRVAPGGSFEDMPHVWDAYWRNALTDAGIDNVEPIAPGSWYVPTTALAGSNLTTFIRVFTSGGDWGDPSTWADPDEIPGLPGGFCLMDSTFGIVVRPECCSDLGTLVNWRSAAAHRDADWSFLWVGHPERWVRYRAPLLQISEPHEAVDGAGATARWGVCPDALEMAIEAAGAELQRLSEVLATILRDWGCAGDVVGPIAETLAGVRSNWE